ncbi:MAG: tryptophan synthase subunit alpha [Gammaproteobacteria bacterium]|nr:tryptophan synthase subunit alpha [Gammaproteobacteria bacterium]
MSRIKSCFDALRRDKRKALIPYVTAGDPQPDVTVSLMHAMVEAGADIIELGVPFSDPMADGPVIQAACERALKHHVSLRNVLGMVREFRTRNGHTPVVLMGYLNPVEVMGYAEFARAADEAGVDGVLTVDLPPEEAEALVTELRTRHLDTIFLLAPTSSAERIARICAMASGFVYYVSLKGVTGVASIDVSTVATKLQQIRALTDLPIGVGFGIKDAASAAQVAAVADAVVVGSTLVKKVGEFAGQPEKIEKEVVSLLAEMRRAIDAVK